MERKQLSEISQNSLPNVCGAKTKFGRCQNPPMENRRCRLHGGLTPKKHPNHQAKFNALKTGRYAKCVKHLVNQINLEIKQLNALL